MTYLLLLGLGWLFSLLFTELSNTKKWKTNKIMAKRQNTVSVLSDMTDYATRYGYDALGMALLDMARNNEIHITQEQMCSLWEYGGNTNLN